LAVEAEAAELQAMLRPQAMLLLPAMVMHQAILLPQEVVEVVVKFRL
jgi:hypothetical protein